MSVASMSSAVPELALPRIIQCLATELAVKPQQISATVALLDDDGPSCRRWEEELRRAIASHALARRLRVLCPSGQVEFERLLRE